MSGSTQSSFLRAPWFLAAILVGILGTTACSRSNAPAGTNHAAPAQIAQQTPAQPAYPPGSKVPSEIDQTLQKAQSGDAVAMYRLGRIYATGSGVTKDYQQALRWYQKAAARGNSDAMYSLGEAYEHGLGVREDVQQAVNWYDQATLRGNKSAKAALVRLGESFDR